jgi:hypothetical protein
VLLFGLPETRRAGLRTSMSVCAQSKTWGRT